MARFTLGMTALLTDPADTHPWDSCRDDLLFWPIDFGQMDKTFEVREVLSAELPMSSGSDDDVGDLVVIARWEPGDFLTGGPMPPKSAEHLLRRWRETPASAVIGATLDEIGLGGPAIIVPHPYEAMQIPMDAAALPGVHIVPVRPVMEAIYALDRPDSDGALAILRMCAVHHFLVTATPEEM